MVVHENDPITAAARIAHFGPVSTQAHPEIGLQLTAIEMNWSSVSFLARHRVTAYSNRGDPGWSDAMDAIFLIGAAVLK